MFERRTAVVALALWALILVAAPMAQNWLKGYQYGAAKATIPYSTADLEYGKTLKLRIDADRDAVTAEKISKRTFGPYRIAGDTYYFGTEQTASVIVKTPEGNVMINYPWGGDYGWGDKNTSQEILAMIAKAGMPITDVKYFLSSEQHGDHNGGVAEAIAKSHAKLITMEGDEKAMENQRDVGFPQPKVDQVIKNGFQLNVGGKVFTAHHTGGHTAGSTTWVWQEKENGQTYNVANVCCWSMPANLVTNPDFTIETLKKSWDRLRSLSVDIPIPGHHPWQFGWNAKRARIEAGENSLSVFVDPAGYRGFVAVYEKMFLDNLAKQLKDGPPKFPAGRRGAEPGARGAAGGRGGQ